MRRHERTHTANSAFEPAPLPDVPEPGNSLSLTFGNKSRREVLHLHTPTKGLIMNACTRIETYQTIGQKGYRSTLKFPRHRASHRPSSDASPDEGGGRTLPTNMALGSVARRHVAIYILQRRAIQFTSTSA